MTHLIHQETMQLKASAKIIRKFIMTPDRILDYYPSPIAGGVLIPDRAIYCRGKSSISMLETVEAESNDNKIVVKVTVANRLKPPFTKFRIEDAVFFTMIEDWKIEDVGDASILIKTWRDLQQVKMKFLPMAYVIRRSAKAESKKLVTAWNKAVESI